jgi:hypothetical protein
MLRLVQQYSASLVPTRRRFTLDSLTRPRAFLPRTTTHIIPDLESIASDNYR